MNGTLEDLVVCFDSLGSEQSHYLEVANGAILMEQNMRFELILDWLVIMKKKKMRIMSNFWGFFSFFGGNFF